MGDPIERLREALEAGELGIDTHDVEGCWKKVSAAAEMKTAIKRLLDSYDEWFPQGVVTVRARQVKHPAEPGDKVRLPKEFKRALRQARRSLEAFTNAG